MPNPLMDYVQAPSPMFDFTDAHTWYDGLWGQGLWPPTGVRGLGQWPGYSHPVFFHAPTFFPGDRGRLAAAGMRGLGQGSGVVVNLSSPTGTVDLTNCDPETVDAYNQGLIPTPSCAAPALPTATNPPCLFGYTGPLQPGQVFCATGTTTPPMQPSPTTTSGTGTVVLIIGGMAAFFLLFMMATRR